MRTGWVDIIALAQGFEGKVCKQPSQHWKLVVAGDESADVICDDGNGAELYRQHVTWTDFSRDEIDFYCCEDGTLGNGIARVILLPSEYRRSNPAGSRPAGFLRSNKASAK